MLLSNVLEKSMARFQVLAQKRYWITLLVILILVVIINGIGQFPSHAYYRLSQNPFTIRTDIDQGNYWQENLLLPLFAYFVQATTKASYYLFCIAIVIAAYILFAVYLYKKFDRFPALLFSILFITSPLTTVLLSWVGTPDGFTIGLTIPFLFSTSYGVLFLLSLLGITNHFAFVIAAGEILILRWITQAEEIKWSHLAVSLFGMVSGYFLVKLFLFSNSIEVYSRFQYVLATKLKVWVAMNMQTMPASLFSLLNVHWLILVICFIMFFNKDRRYFIVLSLFLVLNYGITFFTEDTTRIFAIISWGITFHCMFHSYRLSKKELNREYENQLMQSLFVIALVSIVFPRFYSWQGEIRQTPFKEFIERIFGYLSG